jgi:hypothetical protein
VEQQRTLRDIATCRTAVRGGHVELCAGCGYHHPLFNSCRNRHCPQCQGDKEKAWVETRLQRVVPVGHHQVVFTVPSELRAVTFRFPRVMHAIQFAAASQTLNQLAATRLRARIGFTAVLHTWGRNLSYHPHVHCLVTGGGLREQQDGTRWVDASTFLFPVSVMRRMYRAKFLDRVDDAHRRGLH